MSWRSRSPMPLYVEGRGRLVELGPVGIAALGQPDKYVNGVDWTRVGYDEWLLIFSDR